MTPNSKVFGKRTLIRKTPRPTGTQECVTRGRSEHYLVGAKRPYLRLLGNDSALGGLILLGPPEERDPLGSM